MNAAVLPAAALAERRDFYVYTVSATSLAAGGTASDSFNVDVGSAFLLQKTTFFADLAAAAQTADGRVLPLIKLQLRDSGSSRNWFSEDLPIPLVAGTGEVPFILPVQKLINAGATVTAQFTNYSAATAYNLYLAFHGARVYR